MPYINFKIFFLLIRSELTGEKLADKPDIGEEELQKLIKLAEEHDLAHLIIRSAIKNGLLSDNDRLREYKKIQFTTIGRMIALEKEQDRIMDVLEASGIRYVLLKGCIMRKLYPESWMRTSCDIDILVPGEKLDEAVTAVRDTLRYTVPLNKGFHDISLFSPSGIHLELHHCVLEDMPNIDRVLKRVWEYVVPIEGTSFGYKETPEFFVFHHLAHMYYHVIRGGCGIRPVIDLWLIGNKLEYDRNKLNELIEESGLIKFRDSVERIADGWFGGSYTDEYSQLEKYIISGKVYGTASNEIEAKKVTSGGKLRYILRRIWLPYRRMITLFPWIEGRRYLMPVAQLMRWSYLFKREEFKRIRNELRAVLRKNEKRGKMASDMLKEIGADGR